MRVLFLLAVVVAGCTGPAAPPDDTFDDDLKATADTGIIRGVVVDAAITPVEGVQDGLQDGQSTMIGPDGAFGFQGLAPGTYFITATKAGYNATQTSTEVVAGVDDPPVVKILLPRNPSTAPYVTPYYFKGHMGCSLSYIALCGLPVVSDATDDAFLATFPVELPPQWINMESLWEGTQPTGDQMNLNMGRTPAGPATTCATAQGPSPLLITLDEENITAEDCGIGRDGDLVGRMFAWEMEGTGIDDHTGMCIPVVLTTYCQGPGMALQQDFELFAHLFYNWVPPEGWRFTEHGDPQPPS